MLSLDIFLSSTGSIKCGKENILSLLFPAEIYAIDTAKQCNLEQICDEKISQMNHHIQVFIYCPAIFI